MAGCSGNFDAVSVRVWCVVRGAWLVGTGTALLTAEEASSLSSCPQLQDSGWLALMSGRGVIRLRVARHHLHAVHLLQLLL